MVPLLWQSTRALDLTYKFEWDLDLPNPPYKPVLPISGLPASHPTVAIAPCSGGGYTPGQAIPTNGQWCTTSGCGTCSSVGSGELFYAYAYPVNSCGNTGYVTPNSAAFYMIIDELDEVYLVATMDYPGTAANADSNNRKYFDMTMSSAGLTGLSTPPGVVISDDKGEVAWDASSGTGSATWKWNYKLGDGMVLGPMPPSGFSMDFDITYYTIPSTGGISVRGSCLSAVLATWPRK